MNPRFTLLTALATCIVAVACGCTQALLRENVLATTHTSFGLSIKQSPQSGMYEAEIGYGRNEFFLVPTSKRVVNEGEPSPAASSNDPSCTPEVLAVIGGAASTGSQQVSASIGQALAVGRIAVTSPVAIAAFARDPRTAEAAASATVGKGLSAASPEQRARFIAATGHALNALSQMWKDGDAIAGAHLKDLDSEAAKLARPAGDVVCKWSGEEVLEGETARELTLSAAKSEPYANAADLLENLKVMTESMAALDRAIADGVAADKVGANPASAPAGGAPNPANGGEALLARIALRAALDVACTDLARRFSELDAFAPAMKHFSDAVVPASK